MSHMNINTEKTTKLPMFSMADLETIGIEIVTEYKGMAQKKTKPLSEYINENDIQDFGNFKRV